MFGNKGLLRALVIGGTGGIGSAIVDKLYFLGYIPYTAGKKEIDLTDPESWVRFTDSYAFPSIELIVFAAGLLEPGEWSDKEQLDYLSSYAIHAAGPVSFLAYLKNFGLMRWWTNVIFISSVGAINTGAVDLAYGMAKAALEKAAKALAEHEAWPITLVRLDLVNTKMIKQLPVDTLHGRPVLEPEEAAEFILKEAKIIQ